MDFFKIIFTFFLIADNISKSQSTMIIKRSSDSHSSERLRSIERALMSDNYDELKQQPQRILEKAYSSYRSIITLPPQAETGKMLLHDPYVLQKEKGKKVTKPKKAKRTKEEILQKNRDRIGDWRIVNNKDHNATRRFQYAKNAIESGRNYISKEDRIRLAKTPKRQRESKQDGYYTNASRHERRVQKSIKEGTSREDAIEEANQHFQKLKAWQRKKRS